MTRERLLRLYQYCNAMCDRMALGDCKQCPFFHKHSKECMLAMTKRQIRNVALEAKMETDVIIFDDDAEENYNEIANEISLEEFRIELRDFGYEYCYRGKSCNCCRFYNASLDKCVLNWVDKKLDALLNELNISTP